MTCAVSKSFSNNSSDQGYKLYYLAKPVVSYLYHSSPSNSNNKVTVKPSLDNHNEQLSIELEEKKLLYAKEIEAADGKLYLYIPQRVNQGESVSETEDFYLIPEESPNNNQGGSSSGPNYHTAIANDTRDSRTLHAKEDYKPPTLTRIKSFITGKEDSYVYLDQAYQPLTKVPNSQIESCDQNIGTTQCTGLPSSQQRLHILKTEIVESKDPTTGRRKMELFYLVETQYTRKACEPKDGLAANNIKSSCPMRLFNVEGWLPAKRTIDFKRDENPEEDQLAYSSGETSRLNRRLNLIPKKICNPKNEIIKGVEDVALLLKQAETDRLDSKIGECPKGAKDYIEKTNEIRKQVSEKYQGLIKAELAKKKARKDKVDALEKQWAEETNTLLVQLWDKTKQSENQTPFDAYLRTHWENKYSQNKQPKGRLGFDKMLSIDAMARTFYGEMRSCSHDTSTYHKLVGRVLLNRAAMIKEKGNVVDAFISRDSLNQIDKPELTSIFEILPHVISAPRQISSWNPEDPNLEENLCPEPKTENEIKAWLTAKAVAKEIVLHTDRFLKETAQTRTPFYTSSVDPDWGASMRKYSSVKVKHFLTDPNTKAEKTYLSHVDNPSCIKFFDTPKVNETIDALVAKKEEAYTFNFSFILPLPLQLPMSIH